MIFDEQSASDFLQGDLSDTAQRIRENARQNVGVNPDQEAEAVNLATLTGSSPDAVKRDPDYFRRHAAAINVEAERIAKDTPVFARYYGDPFKSRLMEDDTTVLQDLEKTLSQGLISRANTEQDTDIIPFIGKGGLVPVTAGAVASVPGLLTRGAFGAIRTMEALGRDTTVEPLQTAEVLKYVTDQLDGYNQYVMSGTEGANFVGQGVASMVQSVAQVSAFGPFGLAPLLSSFFVSTGGNAMTDALDKGKDALTALGYGTLQGGIEVATEFLPALRLLGDLKVGTPLGRTIINQVAADLPGELTATTMQGFSEWAVINPDKPFSEWVSSLPEDLGATLVASLLGSGLQPVMLRGIQAIAKNAPAEQQAQQQGQNIKAALTQAATSKLNTRDPATFKQMIADVVQESPAKNLYLSPDVFQQSGVGVDKLAELVPEIRGQITQAQQNGTDIEIPTELVLSRLSTTPEGQALAEHFKTDPNQMSAFEAKTQKDVVLQDVFTQATKEQETRQQWERMKQDVTDSVVEQLNATRRLTPDQARVQAVPFANYASVRASQLGMTPEEFNAKWGAKIISESLTRPGTLEQGPRGFFDPRTMEVAVLKDMNLSTLTHEFGHYALHVDSIIADLPEAPVRLQEDLDTLLTYAGVKGADATSRRAAWKGMTLEQQREHHEKVARSMEAYFFEGKAPTPELQSVFARLRSWLLQVYRSLKNLNVELSDDVRRVFDRMLATEDAIAMAETKAGFYPVFETKPEFMTDKQWEEYREQAAGATLEAESQLAARSVRDMKWLHGAEGRELKRLQKEAGEARSMVRAQVQSEVDAQPVYRAVAFFTRGEVNGVPTEGPHRLNLEDVKSILADDFDKLPNKYGKYGMVAEDGLDPDIAAEMFGYTSADQMLQDIINAPKKEQLVEDITDERMLTQYGDINSPQALREAMAEALHNVARSKFVATQASALAKAAKTGKLDVQAAKAYARQLVDKVPTGRLKAEMFEVAEARASKEIKEAYKSGDLKTAALAARRQLVNFHAARTARDTLARIEKARTYMTGFDKKSVRDKLELPQLDQIDSITSRFDFRRVAKTTAPKAPLADYVAAVEAEDGPALQLSDLVMDETQRRSYKDLTVEEFDGVVDSVRQIDHVGRQSKMLRIAEEMKNLNEVRDEIAKSIRENPNLSDRTNDVLSGWEPNMVSRMRKDRFYTWKMSALIRTLDGYQDNGPMFRNIWAPLMEADIQQTELNKQDLAALKDIIDPLLDNGEMLVHGSAVMYLAGKATGKNFGKGSYIPEINRSLNRGQRLVAALNMGNAHNTRYLEEAHGWGAKERRAILDQLTSEEMKAVQKVWDFFDAKRPQLQKYQEEVLGTRSPWVEAQPVETKHGTFRGGYFPVVKDANQSVEGMADEAARGGIEAVNAVRTPVSPFSGFLKARVKNAKAVPLSLDLTALTSAVQDTNTYLAFDAPIRNAYKILKGNAVKAAVAQKVGTEGWNFMDQTLKDIASGSGQAGKEVNVFLDMLRSKVSIATMGWSFTTLVNQPVGMFVAGPRVGYGNLYASLASYLTNPRRAVREAYAMSRVMQQRGETINREITELNAQMSSTGLTFNALAKMVGNKNAKTVVDGYMNSLFKAIIKSQVAFTDTIIFHAQVNKALRQGLTVKEAVRTAEAAVVETQGGGQIKDLTAIERGGSAPKLLTTWWSFFGSQLQIAREIKGRTKINDAGSVGMALVDYAHLSVIPAFVTTAIFAAAARYGWEDEDEEVGEFAKRVGAESIGNLTGMFPVARLAAGAIPYMFGLDDTPPRGAGPGGLMALETAQQAMSVVRRGEMDESARRTAIRTLSMFAPIPSTQINRTWDGLLAWQEGDADLRALLVGPPK